jgi:hypothetical protein
MRLPVAVIDSLLLPVLNRVGQRSEFRIIVTAPDPARTGLARGLASHGPSIDPGRRE